MSADPTPKPGAIQRLKDRGFSGPAGAVFRGMATLAVGNIVARVIGIAAIPVLTRLYSPEDFGALAVFTSLIAILAPIITLRYVLAIPLPRRDGMAISLLALSVGLMLGTSLIVGLALWAFGPQLLGLFSVEILAPYWWLIILGLIGSSGYEILSLWATRKRAYKPIAKTTATQSLLGNITKLILGFMAIKPLGLLIGQVISTSGGIASLWLHFQKDFAKYRSYISISRVKLVAGRYRHFPVYRLPSQFLLIFSTQAPLLFTAMIYDAGTTGQLGLALMAISLPIGLLSDSMSKAYYAEISNIGKRKPAQIRQITHSMLKRLLAISIPPALILALFGELMFSMVFGEEWQRAGHFASLLAIYLVFQFLQVPVSRILFVFEGHRLLLLLNIQRAMLIIACFAATYYGQLQATQMVLTYAILLSVQYIASIIYTLRFIPK
jgi:O-antigen/teichoic acid export membrane protein